MDGQSDQSQERVHKALTIGFCIVVLLPACLYGSVDAILAQGTAAVTFCFLAILFILVPAPPHLNTKIILSVATTTLVILYALAQAARFPGNPFANPAWSLPIASDGEVPSSISISPHRTLYAIVPIAYAGLAFTGALWLARSDRQPLLFLKTFVYLCGIIAILSIFQFQIAPKWLVAIPKVAYLDSLTTPFVNRNTAATFYALATLVALMTSSRTLVETFDATSQETRLTHRNSSRLGALLLALCGIAALTALILTRSRGGLLSALIAIAFFIPSLILVSMNARTGRPGFGEPRSRIRYGQIALIVLSTFAVAAVFVFLGQRQLLRMDVEGIDHARLCILPQVISLARDNLTWGTGLGTFEQAFNSYRDPQCGIYGRWLSSHNVFLDILVTSGLPGLLLTICVVGYLAFVLVGGTRNRRRQRALPLGGLAALLLVVAHSLVDFSIEVPGFAVPFAAVMGACVAASIRPQASAAIIARSQTKDPDHREAKDWWNDPGDGEPSRSKRKDIWRV